MLRSQDLARNSTCYEHQSCYIKKIARSTENIKARVIASARRRRANIEHVRARQEKASDERAQLYKITIFFLKKTSCKSSCYIAINLIIFITKTLLLFWYLFLFNIFLNLARLPSRNITCIMENKKNILGNVRSSSHSFNKNNNFNKFF